MTHITVSKFYALNVLKNVLCIYGINACLFLCHMVWIYGQFASCKLKKKKVDTLYNNPVGRELWDSWPWLVTSSVC